LQVASIWFRSLDLSKDLSSEAWTQLDDEILKKMGRTESYTRSTSIKEFVNQKSSGMVVSLYNEYSITLIKAKLQDYVDRELSSVVETPEDGSTMPMCRKPTRGIL
jgi:hypothetical protein